MKRAGENKKIFVIPLLVAVVLCAVAGLFLSRRAPAPTPPTQPAPADVGTVKSPTSELLISSRPSGATIWINATNTGLLTPSRVEVPADGKFLLMLQKRGYATYVNDRVFDSVKKSKLEVVLARPKRSRPAAKH